MAKIGSATKTTHKAFFEGGKLGYGAVIMTTGEYHRRVTAIDSAWTFKKPANPATYDPGIKY